MEFRRDIRKHEIASRWIKANRDLLRAVNNAHICIVLGEYGRVLAARKIRKKVLGLCPIFRS
jgi:hypothetical protein